MSPRRMFVPSPSMAVAMGALVVALGGVAVAAIPGPDGVIHACISDGTQLLQQPPGTLRVIDSGASCAAGETPLNFNQTGPAAAAAGDAMPSVYSERTTKSKTVGAKKTTLFSVTLPAGSYEVRGTVHFTQPQPLKVDQLAECSVVDPAKKVVTDSTAIETLKAGGGDDAANVAIDTVVANMPQGTLTIVCDDVVAPGAPPATASGARARAADAAAASPGVLSGNVIQVPVHVPVNVCGDTINVIGLLNPAAGNTCVNA